MNRHHGVLAELGGGVHVLCLDGLVDKDLEGGKVMKVKLTAEPSVEPPTEPFLFLGVGGDLFSCVTNRLNSRLYSSTVLLPWMRLQNSSHLWSIRPLGMWCSRNAVQNSFHAVGGPSGRMLR